MAAIATLEFKRGTTFSLSCVAYEDDGTERDVTDDTITCHVRRVSSDSLINSCTVTKTDAANGAFTCVVADESTASWALAPHYTDIRYARTDGTVFKTETIRFRVVIDATRS